jgi:hypothetical protein
VDLWGQSTLAICFNASVFAAVPSLVEQDDLVTANGRIQASFSVAQISGPLLAGLLVLTLPVYMLMLGDALSFLLSVCSLLLIRRGFNATRSRFAREESETEKRGPVKRILHDIVEGLSYVWRHPILT